MSDTSHELQARLERLIAEVRELVDAAAMDGIAEGFRQGHAAARLEIMNLLQSPEAVVAPEQTSGGSAAQTGVRSHTEVALEWVRENPGTTVTEAKKATGIRDNVLYKLAEKHKVHKKGEYPARFYPLASPGLSD